MLEILSAIAIAVGSSMAIHDLTAEGTQAEERTPVVEVAPVQSVDPADETGELGR